VCRNTKYILQKSTPKIKQSAIQLAAFLKAQKTEPQTNMALLHESSADSVKQTNIRRNNWSASSAGAWHVGRTMVPFLTAKKVSKTETYGFLEFRIGWHACMATMHESLKAYCYRGS
jgi:hypothetical protein